MNNGMFNGYGMMPNRYSVAPYSQPAMPMYSQPQVQQPVQQQVPVSELPISLVKFLTADQIKGFIADAGTKALLIDKQNSLAHLIWADYSGQSYAQVFKFNTFKPEDEKPVIQPILDDKLYVKKEELEGLFKEINDKIDKLSKQVKINEILEGK